MADDDRMGGFTPARATRFFVPLLLQAFSQCLTYPLVAAIVSHGELGVEGYAAYDDTDGDITKKVEVTVNDDTVQYKVRDSAGNITIRYRRIPYRTSESMEDR